MLRKKEMSFSNVIFFGLVSVICICGSRGDVVALSSLSVADSPHQQDEVASSPADVTPPKTLPAPNIVPLPTGLSPVSAPSVSEAIPPTVHSSTAVQPPSSLSTDNRSPPVASPLHGLPISPVSPVQPTQPEAPPPQGSDFQASPPAPAVATPPIVQPLLPKAPPPQGGDSQSSPPTPAIVSPPSVQPSLPKAPPPQGSQFQTTPPTPAIQSPPIVQPSLPKVPPPQGADSQGTPPAPVIVPTPRVQPSLPNAPPPSQSDSQESPPSATVSPPSDPSLPNSPPPEGSDFQASPPASNIPSTVPPPTAQGTAPAKSPTLQPSVGNPPSTSPAPDQRNVAANPPRQQPNIGNAPPSRSSALAPGHAISPVSSKPDKNWTSPVAPTPKEGTGESISPAYSSPIKGSPLISPMPQHIPQMPYAKAPANTHTTPPSIPMPHISPSASSKLRPHQQRSRKGTPSPATAPLSPPKTFPGPRKSPTISPSMPLPVKPTEAPAQSVMTLPPPPPNLDCNYLTCQDPLTDPIIGSPCTCVLPIKVGLRLTMALYTFFPLVSNFSQEIGSGVKMSQQQVRVMGANVAEDQADKTVVLVDLVPAQSRFDNATAFSTYEGFWKKQVPLSEKDFGDYQVLYVLYPGLPEPPPSAAGNLNLDGSFRSGGNSRTIKPLGVDVGQRPRYHKNNGSIIAVVVVSCLIALTIFTVVAWMILLRRRDLSNSSPQRLLPRSFLSTFGGSSGTGHMLLPAQHSSACSSFRSSMATYSGQAKNFRLAEIERATNYFDNSRILGEGGFGCVYRGILDDETQVAVKVLKRYDGQGEREFLSEVEMLGRLHHRNLVKLIGICVEENARCLVYELIPNGSVESHLHGLDKQACLLDWSTRMKIALGAARGLAYLHEDSSPCVIHRDFKSSNILLDHDFTPKVSDFGLARTALDEGNRHISTRVMGTFGYVAPEYAMTGHLLVKSDVYSYGVVLLELLTGRKPVDMSRPSGQENLVTWARPLLTSVDGLNQIVDPALGPEVPFDRVAKAAAIASMCVQPEVAHRPSMSEVVQALKLVCNLSDEYKDYGTCSQELMVHAARILGNGSGIEAERVLLSEMFASPPVYNIYNGDVGGGYGSGSFRRYNSSGPLVTGKSRKFWQRLRSNTGSMSDHGTSFGFDTRSEGSDQ
ncbi:Protein kinase superfamily protein [Rhynchospora pubera]|uniref:Protein kinase superfamily protein n=1 Tax=Rhynchospora pubera TaxID=906938 RepID=A0AAV8DJB9_9POAL|nr:Protein kinase superfamily protein [Rhynchospora pubera]